MQEIKNFIYLDIGKVSSLYSQLTGGIVQQPNITKEKIKHGD